MKLTHKFAGMTPDKRPQDPHLDGPACASNHGARRRIGDLVVLRTS